MNNKFEDMQSDNFDDSKRKSLIKMGRRAVYMSPVVLTLLTSQKATAMSVSVTDCVAHGGSNNNCGVGQGLDGNNGTPNEGL